MVWPDEAENGSPRFAPLTGLFVVALLSLDLAGNSGEWC